MERKTGVRTATICEIVERYIDCPYCNVIISDNSPFGICEHIEELTGDTKIKCPSCHKTIRVKW